VHGRRAIVTARRSGFGRAVDETEHIEHALAALNLRHNPLPPKHEIASRSMEGGIAAVPMNFLQYADHTLTQFARCAVTADARRQFEHFGRHHTPPTNDTTPG
jgi:hypothetical protein